MGKVRVLSGSDVADILQANGFTAKKRGGTSHCILKSADGQSTVIVPDHKTIKPGTLSAIIRQSKLPRSHFEC